MRDIQQALADAIVSALAHAEGAGELVICTGAPVQIADRISESVRGVYSGGIFSPEELFALSALIFHATSDKRFYDWEMPVLLGYTAEQMAELGNRIRQLSSL